jgi:hypothetical protein
MKFGEGDDLQVEAYGRYDRRDAYQRDYDHSVAGMGKRQSRAYQDDGGANDERHDLDPTDWYFVKDGKMFAISVYPNQEREAIARGYSRTRSEAKAKASNEGVAEGYQSSKTTEQIKFWYKDAADAVEMAKAAEALNVNGMYDEAIKKYKHQAQISLSKANSLKQGMAEGSDSEELANEVYAEFERTYPNLARRADERTIHAAIIDVLNYGGDSNPSALAQDVARAVKRNMQQGVSEGPPKDPNAPKLVQDRKTGKWYDPNKEFEKKMNSPEVMAQMKRMAQKEGAAEGSEDTVKFEVDSENAYNHVMKQFGSVVEWDGDTMVAPRKYWGSIQELAYSAGGEATEVGNEQGMAENKKGVRAAKHTVKPRNFVAKNAVQSGAGAHKDKKKAAKQGDTKHKATAYENRLESALQSALMEKAPKGWEGTVKAMKKHDEIENPYALAHYMKNKGYKSHKKK